MRDAAVGDVQLQCIERFECECRLTKPGRDQPKHVLGGPDHNGYDEDCQRHAHHCVASYSLPQPLVGGAGGHPLYDGIIQAYAEDDSGNLGRIGNGAERHTVSDRVAVAGPTAVSVGRLALLQRARGEAANLATVVPIYGRPPDITVKKVRPPV